MSVHNSDLRPNGDFGEVCGYADQPDPEGEPGSLLVYFYDSEPGPYFVLETDYENFAAVYSCDELPGFGAINYGWVLTRDPNPSQEIVSYRNENFSY